MDSPQDGQHRIVSTGERPVKRDKLTKQHSSPKDERTISANPSPDAVIIGSSRDATEQTEYAGGDRGIAHPVIGYASHEQGISFGGHGSTAGTWDGYSQYVNADSLNVVSSVMYNDSPSVVFHSGYGFNPDMAYGQYSPVATPIPSVMVDGQLYSPQQVPFSPSYYPQQATPGLPHVSSTFPVSPSDLVTQEASNIENMLYGPGSGYLVNFGSFGGGNLPGNLGSGPLTSTGSYPQSMGILGSYEHNVGQVSQQQRPVHGFGLVSNAFTGHYHQGSSYQGSNFGGASISYSAANDHNRLSLDKGRRREKERESISLFNDSNYIFNDRNRGPRASRVRGKDAAEQGSYFDTGKNDSFIKKTNHDSHNRPDFVTDYENAKFFIIKSFSEDNVHKSIKYKVWASTPHGNKKLDAGYHEAREIEGSCPIFLFFSVNASGQFCGVAEMVGPVDFQRSADYWQQDRWSGQFPVQWHMIKDVPNIRFRHIVLENNDNKPVTHSRDSQEVKRKQGIEMLKIFKDHDARTSILDDFDFYDEREKVLKERKARQQPFSTMEAPKLFAGDSINKMSGSYGRGSQLDGCNKVVAESEQVGTSRTETSLSLDDPIIKQTSDRLSQVMRLEQSDEEAQALATGNGHQI